MTPWLWRRVNLPVDPEFSDNPDRKFHRNVGIPLKMHTAPKLKTSTTAKLNFNVSEVSQ
jgi:hypothetical protein